MRHHWVLPLLAAGVGIAAASGARAAGQGPFIIPGIGPETEAAQPAPMPMPMSAPRRQRVATGGSGLGGGFLELIMTGRDPGPPAPVQAPEWRPARQPAYIEQQPRPEPRYQRAAYAPDAQPVSPVRGAIAAEFQRQEVDYREIGRASCRERV